MAYDLYTRAGVPAPLTSFVRVRVNGEDLGVYTRVETIDKAFLRRAFGNDAGVLWEGYAGDFVGFRTQADRREAGRARIGSQRDSSVDGATGSAGAARRGRASRR